MAFNASTRVKWASNSFTEGILNVIIILVPKLDPIDYLNMPIRSQSMILAYPMHMRHNILSLNSKLWPIQRYSAFARRPPSVTQCMESCQDYGKIIPWCRKGGRERGREGVRKFSQKLKRRKRFSGRRGEAPNSVMDSCLEKILSEILYVLEHLIRKNCWKSRNFL